MIMTLLLPRIKMKQDRYPYAVQMAIPKELTPGKMTLLTSVRLIHENGNRATALETMDYYEPKKWRAASRSEQGHFAAEFNANPQPWYSIVYSLSKNVYKYRGSGRQGHQQWSAVDGG
jgi:hypothetical protein